MWARIMSKGVSQRDIDFMRGLFPPEWIPGHDFISDAKVFFFSFCFSFFKVLKEKKKKKKLSRKI